MSAYFLTKRRMTGFTLIELMIVVSIIGILAMIAYPSYQDSVTKSRRADAKAALSAAALAQEKWFFQFNGYADDVDNLGGDGNNELLSPEGYYSITVDNNEGEGTCNDVAPFNCYTLTATPVAGGPQATDTKCTTLTITQTGVRAATGTQAGECW